MSDMQDTETSLISRQVLILNQTPSPSKYNPQAQEILVSPVTLEQREEISRRLHDPEPLLILVCETLPPETEKDLSNEALLDGIFASLNQADQRINSTQKSIDALAAETKTMLSQLKELV